MSLKSSILWSIINLTESLEKAWRSWSVWRLRSARRCPRWLRRVWWKPLPCEPLFSSKDKTRLMVFWWLLRGVNALGRWDSGENVTMQQHHKTPTRGTHSLIEQLIKAKSTLIKPLTFWLKMLILLHCELVISTFNFYPSLKDSARCLLTHACLHGNIWNIIFIQD